MSEGEEEKKKLFFHISSMFQFHLHQGGRCQPGACSRWNSPAQAGTWNTVSHQTWCTLPFTCFSLLHMMARGAVSGNSQSSPTIHIGEGCQQLHFSYRHANSTCPPHPLQGQTNSKWKRILGDTSSSQLGFTLWKSMSPRFSDQYYVNWNHAN